MQRDASAPPARSNALEATVRRPLKVLLARPRGFCAGVERAIGVVEEALQRYGAPVYVRHEIVHNRHVVDRLRTLGAVFVSEVDEAPADRPLIFSAHGAPRSAAAWALKRGMHVLDATCPLVTKVHRAAERYFGEGREIILIGHEGHPEVTGTIGQLPAGAVQLVEGREDVAALEVRDPDMLAYVTQTTLSLEDVADIIAALKARFPRIVGPRRGDICYATANRQTAVKALTDADLILVLGSETSSNARRLVDVALAAGTPARLIEDPAALANIPMDGIASLGVTAAASTPETLVEQLLERLATSFDVTVDERAALEESVQFKLPQELLEPSG